MPGTQSNLCRLRKLVCNAGKSFAYWRSLLQAGTPQAASGMLKQEMIDGAYQQWLDTVQRFYNPLEKSGS